MLALYQTVCVLLATARRIIPEHVENNSI